MFSPVALQGHVPGFSRASKRYFVNSLNCRLIPIMFPPNLHMASRKRITLRIIDSKKRDDDEQCFLLSV
jgi:hypothetical protein